MTRANGVSAVKGYGCDVEARRIAGSALEERPVRLHGVEYSSVIVSGSIESVWSVECACAGACRHCRIG